MRSRSVKSGIVSAAAIGLMLVGSAAMAEHSTWVSFDPGATVTEGTEVTVSANSSEADNAPKLQLHVCRVAEEGTPISPATYAPYATCNAATDGTAVWYLVKEQDANTTVDKIDENFDTTGLGGQTVGFRSWREPGPNNNHPDAMGFADLVVNTQSSGGGGEHPGCKGVENAYAQVSTNNGSSKGKGGEALEKVAAKLGCELS